jgi:hypothetical protein
MEFGKWYLVNNTGKIDYTGGENEWGMFRVRLSNYDSARSGYGLIAVQSPTCIKNCQSSVLQIVANRQGAERSYSADFNRLSGTSVILDIDYVDKNYRAAGGSNKSFSHKENWANETIHFSSRSKLIRTNIVARGGSGKVLLIDNAVLH